MIDQIQQVIHDTLSKIYSIDIAINDIAISIPRLEHGDIATNIAFQLAKKLHIPPLDIAETIVKKISTSTIFSDVSVAGKGFINFRFNPHFLHTTLYHVLNNENGLSNSDGYRNKRINIEFVSANPTGPLTVGHGRNAVLGDTLANMFTALGASVCREYYFNNAGRQMRLLGESVKARYCKLHGKPYPLPKDGYQGTYITDIAKHIKKDVNHTISIHSTEEDFKHYAEKFLLKDIKHTLKRLGIKMDLYFNEQQLYKNGDIDVILDKFKEKDLIYNKDGAIWLKTTDKTKNMDTVLVKSSGEPTYRLPDIAYHINKYNRNYDLYIDILGADHVNTYPDVFFAMKSLGYDISRFKAIIYQFVTLLEDGKPIKMSTRKADYITLDELIDLVGADITRLYFLTKQSNTHLLFDIKVASQMSEKNPMFYIQYAHARIKSILNKAVEPKTYNLNALQYLTAPEELTLLKQVLLFPYYLHQATDSCEPHRLVNYLYDLSTYFSSFYHQHRIIGEKETYSTARCLLINATAQVIKKGLDIIGVDAPEQM